METELTKAEMTAIRDRAFAELRAASTEEAIIDAVSAAHRAFYGDARHAQPYFPVNVVFLEGSANAFRAEACRRDDDSLEAFRLWRLVDIHAEAAVSTRLLRTGGDAPSRQTSAPSQSRERAAGDPATTPVDDAPPMPTDIYSREEVRRIFDEAIGNLQNADSLDADRIARLELLREYFCNTEFRADFHELCFRLTSGVSPKS